MGKRSVVVVGAGVFGAWSALRLARDGWRVTLVDAYGPANGRASSADHSRVIRAGYGPLEIYSRWATESLADWHWLATTSGQPLVEECGALFLGRARQPAPRRDGRRCSATSASRTSGSTGTGGRGALSADRRDRSRRRRSTSRGAA